MIAAISLMIFQTMNPVIASALMPGLGQQIQGEQSKARIFYTVEGAIWLSYFGFNYMGSKIELSARAFAIKHAEGNPARTEDDYYDALEDYLSSEHHNLDVERTASRLYPNDLERQQEYIELHGYFGNDIWEWDSISNRSHYWDERKNAREHRRRASFMPGFAIINRIVSVIDVVVFAENEKVGLDTRPGKIGIYYKF